MVIWVRNAKGYKDRSLPLPIQTLTQLRIYWLKYRPKIFLFPSKKGTVPITTTFIYMHLTQGTMVSVQKKINEIMRHD
jgi:integrase